MPKVILRVDGLPVQTHSLEQPATTIGRHSENDIQLDDPTVSGNHAIVSLRPSPYLEGHLEAVIKDSGSTNGTKVNGIRVIEHILKHGDVIVVGGHELIYEEDQEGLDTTVIFLSDTLHS